MNVLSLFDGISCGRVALERANIEVNNYFSSEIDPYAIKVAQNNYPDTIQLGSVTELNDGELKELPKIDILLGGSPCQDISLAMRNNRKGIDGERSKLFFEFLRILKWLKDNNNSEIKFLLENVKGSKKDIEVINDLIGINSELIDSKLLSPQIRKRHYWSNIAINSIIPKAVKLQDIIENGYTDKEKAYCLTATYAGACVQNYFIKSERQLIFNEPVRVEKIKGGRVYHFSNESISIFPSKGADENRKELNKLKKYTRKLTPLECERLQTLPDGYTTGISNSQRYKAIGNGWTVDVIAHILKGLN